MRGMYKSVVVWGTPEDIGTACYDIQRTQRLLERSLCHSAQRMFLVSQSSTSDHGSSKTWLVSFSVQREESGTNWQADLQP